MPTAQPSNTHSLTYSEDGDGDNDRLVLERFAPLHMILNTPKGRAIIAAAPIPRGTIIDISPVLVLDPEENRTYVEKTSLYHYTYNWPLSPSLSSSAAKPHPNGTANGTTTNRVNHSSTTKHTQTQAVVLGLGSMFNHSHAHQNVGWKRDLHRQVIVYTALRDVQMGEELCISYGDHLTFVDADHVGQEEEDGEEKEDGRENGRVDLESDVLGRIEWD